MIDYLEIFLLMIVESIGFPVPSEIILPLAGYYSSQGIINPEYVIIISTLGSIIGSIIDYFLAFKLGIPFLHKYGKIFGLSLGRLNKLNLWFSRYGTFSVFIFRFIPEFRALISFPAGIASMQIAKFLISTFLGNIIWDSILVFIGFAFPSTWELIINIAYRYLIYMTILLAFGIILYMFRNKLKISSIKNMFLR